MGEGERQQAGDKAETNTSKQDGRPEVTVAGMTRTESDGVGDAKMRF